MLVKWGGCTYSHTCRLFIVNCTLYFICIHENDHTASKVGESVNVKLSTLWVPGPNARRADKNKVLMKKYWTNTKMC